jgi:hypothetical protein
VGEEEEDFCDFLQYLTDLPSSPTASLAIFCLHRAGSYFKLFVGQEISGTLLGLNVN